MPFLENYGPPSATFERVPLSNGTVAHVRVITGKQRKAVEEVLYKTDKKGNVSPRISNLRPALLLRAICKSCGDEAIDLTPAFSSEEELLNTLNSADIETLFDAACKLNRFMVDADENLDEEAKK